MIWPTFFKKQLPANRKTMTVCITTSPMKGKEDGFLRHNLEILSIQTFKDFDVVVSDQSPTTKLENVCAEFKNKLDIHYYHNPKGPYTSSENVNRAISHATGKLIKFIFLDDYLYHKDAIKDIVDNFDLEKDGWLVTASEHTRDGKTYYMPFYPKYNDQIHLGENTISSPSVLTIKNDNPLKFDRRMLWLMDVDYYKRLYLRYGAPKIVNKINVVNRTGDHQVSTTRATKDIRGIEYRWVLLKFKEKELLKKYDSVMTPTYRFKNWFRKTRLYQKYF